MEPLNVENSPLDLLPQQTPSIHILETPPLPSAMPPNLFWQGDVECFLAALPAQPVFDLVVTSPPYNIGKAYEQPDDFERYLGWQSRIIEKIYPLVKETGSICWQVGNYVSNGSIVPLDIELHPTFRRLGMQLRNRIVWKFGHGLHAKRRFSGRYEVIMWYTKSDSYIFNLDPVRVPVLYPGKRHFKGPKVGQYSSHPLGKNPEDVWEIPNVKSNHVEKTSHPCQFPVGLVERLVLSLTNPTGLVFDPFAGVGSAGVAALLHRRHFWGAELSHEYVSIGHERLVQTLAGTVRYRPHDKPLYDPGQSKLSIPPSGALPSDLELSPHPSLPGWLTPDD